MFPWVENHLIFPSLVSIIVSILLFKLANSRKSKLNLPPSPWKLPVLGNLHQLGFLPHRSLQSLAKKHGPLMFLHLGQVPTLVVSSAYAVKEIFTENDLNFSSRPKMKVGEVLFYSTKDVALSPYNEYWRQMRKIVVIQLLSAQRTESFRSIRKEEGDLMIKRITQSCTCVVDLCEILNSLSMDITCRVALGKKYSRDNGGWDFLKLIRETLQLMGTFNVGDFIPWLAWVDHLNGFNAMLDRTSKGMDSFLESIIEEHIHHRSSNGEGHVDDFVDVLLRIEKEGSIKGVPFTRDNIKALILDVFLAGTDSTATTLVWVMTELIRHPEILEKVQREIREIGNGKGYITEVDLEQMQYMKMAIMETLRVHPPAPLLGPRETIETTKLLGYDIPAKTRVIINAWAVGRDPLCWDSPEKFIPERFQDTSGDYKGADFEYIPFGIGRRICAGMRFAKPNMEFPLANLLFHFDWSLPDGTSAEHLDITEDFGIVTRKKLPLLLVATLASH